MKILFFCSANVTSGIGHLIRCHNIAEFLRKNKSLIVDISGNIDSHFIKSKGYNNIKIESSVVYEDYDVIIFDSYSKEDYEIVKKLNLKKIAIDDLEIFDYQDWDLVINFRFKNHYKNYKAKKIITGLNFFPVNSFFTNLRKRHRGTKKIKNLFFYFGETKNIEITKKTLDIIGKYSDEYNFYIKSTYNSPLFTKINNENYHNLFSTSEMIIHGGGLTKYESAYSKKFNIAFSLTRLQKEDTEILAKFDLVKDMGNFTNFETVLISSLDYLNKSNIFEDILRFEDSSSNYFSDRSLENIAEEISKVIY